MSEALATGTISGDLKSAPDYIFSDETLPNNTSAASDAWILGMTQDSIEIVGKVGTEVELADTKALTITMTSATSESGTYGNSVTLYTKTASGAETIAAGTELFRYAIAKDTGPWIKITIASTDTGEVGTVTVFPVMVA